MVVLTVTYCLAILNQGRLLITARQLSEISLLLSLLSKFVDVFPREVEISKYNETSL